VSASQCAADAVDELYDAERDVLRQKADAAEVKLVALGTMRLLGTDVDSGVTAAIYDKADAAERLATLRGRNYAERIAACKRCPGRSGCERSVADYKLT
jgi:hypothetical protein